MVGPEVDDVVGHVSWTPLPVGPGGLRWRLTGSEDVLPAARAVIAWADLTARRPGRLRPCGNEECLRFLVDRSKGNSARWCSMATCGNRMKARRHQSRKSSAEVPRTPRES
ncbi:CGNR zinc finger domain-containing protein [Jannaschia sp. R86511]|uniref:CGNR zinc finger domain-containing protein n=1 Tax=Jannaschia sp. R86511 TaxID=3093853 RepID=UPI0036D29F33